MSKARVSMDACGARRGAGDGARMKRKKSDLISDLMLGPSRDGVDRMTVGAPIGAAFENGARRVA